MASKQRASGLDGLLKEKPSQPNLSSVGEAPMVLDPPKAQVEQPAPVPVKEAEPQQVLTITPETAAPLLPPVHPRQVKEGYSQLSIKLSGQLLARFEEAKYRTGLKGQNIATEALDIWLAHNGF